MDTKKFVLSYYKNAAKDFYITRITAPKEALKPHSHNYFQVYYVANGGLVHHLKESSAELKSGDAFILPPDILHYIDIPYGKVDFFSMSFMPSFFDGIESSNKLIRDFLYYLKNATLENIQPKISLSHGDIDFIEVLFNRIMLEFSQNKTGKNELIRESVSVLISLFARVYFEEKADVLNTTLNSDAVNHCIQYIKTHYDEDITLSEIAKLSAMSKTAFCSIFSSITGTTFKDYLNSYRIKKAAELISKGEKISMVSSVCGYNNFSTFYRNFVKYMNQTPIEYKKVSKS